MIARLMDLFEGPDSLAPWAPPEMPPPLHELLPWRAWDERSELYVNAGSHGFVLELPPFAGIDDETLGGLAGTLADAAPERCTIQIVHWASPRFGAPLSAWAGARGEAGGVRAAMAGLRLRLFEEAGWRPLHPGGPPFTCNDFRVFLAACLPGLPGPASETALASFRRALEGTLASSGATARRLEPDALLMLAAEIAAPDIPGFADGGLERPMRRWSPRDPIHIQCAAPGRALSVAPTGLVFHHPDGSRRGGPGDCRRAGALGAGLPRGLAGLARQRPDRRLPPRLPAGGLPGADRAHHHDRRGGRRRARLPQIRPGHPAGRHRHRQIPAGTP